eukprot:6317024-Lingulodinium_polyedra.AAC.1
MATRIRARSGKGGVTRISRRCVSSLLARNGFPAMSMLGLSCCLSSTLTIASCRGLLFRCPRVGSFFGQ